MENFFAFLIKLTTIFVGSGLLTLFCFWIFKEISTIPKLILGCEEKEKLSISRHAKISSKSALYEIILDEGRSLESNPVKQTIKIFSSHKGMKVMN